MGSDPTDKPDVITEGLKYSVKIERFKENLDHIEFLLQVDHCSGVSWEVWRRFSEFWALYERVLSDCSSDPFITPERGVNSVPEPPPKKWLPSFLQIFDNDTCKERCQELQRYTNSILEKSLLLQHKAVHEILGTLIPDAPDGLRVVPRDGWHELEIRPSVDQASPVDGYNILIVRDDGDLDIRHEFIHRVGDSGMQVQKARIAYGHLPPGLYQFSVNAWNFRGESSPITVPVCITSDAPALTTASSTDIGADDLRSLRCSPEIATDPIPVSDSLEFQTPRAGAVASTVPGRGVQASSVLSAQVVVSGGIARSPPTIVNSSSIGSTAIGYSSSIGSTALGSQVSIPAFQRRVAVPATSCTRMAAMPATAMPSSSATPSASSSAQPRVSLRASEVLQPAPPSSVSVNRPAFLSSSSVVGSDRSKSNASFAEPSRLQHTVEQAKPDVLQPFAASRILRRDVPDRGKPRSLEGYSNPADCLRVAVGTEHSKEDSDLCVVCLSSQKTHAFIPCGHQCVCVKCGDALVNGTRSECPMCRVPAERVIQIFA